MFLQTKARDEAKEAKTSSKAAEKENKKLTKDLHDEREKFRTRCGCVCLAREFVSSKVYVLS